MIVVVFAAFTSIGSELGIDSLVHYTFLFFYDIFSSNWIRSQRIEGRVVENT